MLEAISCKEYFVDALCMCRMNLRHLRDMRLAAITKVWTGRIIIQSLDMSILMRRASKCMQNA